MRQIFYVINGKEYSNFQEALANGYTQYKGEVIFKDVTLDDFYNKNKEREENNNGSDNI